MSFGWSAGDIVSCIALVVRVSKGLKDSTGAPAEYEAALAFLDGLKTTLDKLKEHLETYPDTFHAKDIEEQAERLKTAVEKFKSKAEKFEASLGSDSTRSSLRRAPRKIQWTLFADSITELQKAISQPQNVLNTILLLQTLKAAEQASRTSALSQQELAKIALAVIEILPAQLRATADSLKLVLTETLESIAEERQIEMLETREEIQKLRDSIEEHGEKFTNLDLSVETQQRLILDAVESCTQAHLESLVEAMSLDELSEQRSDIKSEEGKAVAQTLVSAEGLSSFFGMAAGLHMLGFLISGVLGPMLRGPSAMRTGGGPWRFESPFQYLDRVIHKP
ncbi:hypothetical protein N431DRAFT_350578 [Stipitochalara longipes BDJ]|nr:hypothetical protein N431DRAFT_350578 [Stipitochalara longipes BDJ]